MRIKTKLKVLALALLCILSLPVSLSTATAFVQSDETISFSGTTVVAVLPSNMTAGNLIAVHINWSSEVITLDSVTDSDSNSYTILHNPTTGTASTHSAALAYAGNIAGGSATITATFSASIGSRIIVHEVSGVDTTTPLDKSDMQGQDNPGTGTDAITSPSITPGADGAYIFGTTTTLSGVLPTAGTNFTIRENPVGGARVSEDLIQATAAAIAATFTTSSSSADYITGIMAFKEAGAAPAAVRRKVVVY